MSDYNKGTLQEPCLRLDYGFGEQWDSVELGDGTGYVRLADYEKVETENAELRELVRHMHTCIEHYEPDGSVSCDRCPLDNDTGNCDYEQRMRDLGIVA